MTDKRFNEILAEYGVKILSYPRNLRAMTEDDVRRLARIVKQTGEKE